MTSDELKKLCADFISEMDTLRSYGGGINNSFYGYISGEETLALATEALRLLAENEAMRAALKDISSVKYGLDFTEDEEYLSDYWGKRAVSYECIARKALSRLTPEAEK